jgi:hypothetical protein
MDEGIDSTITPSTSNTYDLGSSSLRWRNIYTTDLQLSNMEREVGNEVDGTRGNWTLQEGKDDLYIINRLNGKHYKINLKVTNDGSQTFVKWDKLVAVEQVLYTDDDFDIPEGKSVGDVRIAATASMDTPSSVLSLSTKSQEYTQSEILNILTGSAWVPEAE